ncbi:MAG TPA: hypothetical protein DEF85_08055, partial [Clostridiaceae bacterium]|nr:hypothetical protein [Clostridiaceae bacterium]
GKYAIKLYDGTIIPAIFLDNLKLNPDLYSRFYIKGFSDDILLLKVEPEKNETNNVNSFESILQKLDIPYEKGKDIIMSLLKFNLPASNENILSIYKNIEFINKINNFNDEHIVNFLKENINSTINYDSIEFKVGKEVFNLFKNVDVDFLTFLVENNLDINIDNLCDTSNIIKDKFSINNFIDECKNFLSNNAENDMPQIEYKLIDDVENGMEQIEQKAVDNSKQEFTNNNEKAQLNQPGLTYNNEKAQLNQNEILLTDNLNASYAEDSKLNTYNKQPNLNISNKTASFDKEILKFMLKKAEVKGDKEINIVSLNDILISAKESSKISSPFLPQSMIKMIDNISILKFLYNNYNLYYFNTYIDNKTYKNNIIIKNKYKSYNHIDENDVKAFINVETPNLGNVEGYLIKKNKNLIITLKTDNAYVPIFKS